MSTSSSIKLKYVDKFLSGFGFPEDLQGELTGEVPFLKVSDINSRHREVKTAANYVSLDLIAQNGWKPVPSGSIVMAKIGAALTKNHRKVLKRIAIIDNNILAVMPRSNIDTGYHYWLWKVIDLTDFQNISSVPSVNMTAIKNLTIKLPGLTSQKKIANFLDKKVIKIDEAIAKKKQLLQLLEEKRTAAISKAVVGNGARIKLSLKRFLSIPITDGPHETPELVDEGVPFVSAESIKNGYLDFDLRRGNITKLQHIEYCQKAKPQRDDVFMIKSGATTGKVAIVETDDEFSIWSPLALIRADKSKILPRYLYFSLLSDYFQEQVVNSWSFGTQQNIGMNVIESLQIPSPSIKEQKRIIEELDKVNALTNKAVEQIDASIDLLEEYKTSLISSAVTGEVKI